MTKKSEKLLKELQNEFEKILEHFNNVELLIKFLEGTYTPKFSKRYLLYVKKRTSISETFANSYCINEMPFNSYISSETPLMILLPDNDGGALRLVPKDEKYVILRPNVECTLRIIGWEDAEIHFKLGPDMKLLDAKLNLNGLYELVHSSYPTISYCVNKFTQNVVELKKEGKPVDYDAMLEELNRSIAKKFLDSSYASKMWVKAVLLEDITLVRYPIWEFAPEVLPKVTLINVLRKNFEKITDAINEVKLLED